MKYHNGRICAGNKNKMADLRSEINKIFNEIKETFVDFAEIMTKLGRIQFSATLTINAQVKLVTELANCPKFKPQNWTEAEQRVNGLLKYLGSPKYTVCALACSLLKIYCDFLDKNSQHIATQGTITETLHNPFCILDHCY